MSANKPESGPVRRSRLMRPEEAAALVKDGSSLALGGFINSSHAMILVRELIRKGVSGLTVVGAASAGLELDLMIAAGCVRRVIAPYVGGEALAAVGPAFRAAAQQSQIDVFEIDEAMYYAGLRAAAQRVPFNPWVAGLGTSYPQVNPAIKQFNDPLTGAPLLAIPAINIDVAFLHAAQSDIYGNVQYVGHGYGDRAISAAADITIVQVEKIVSNEEIKADPGRTAIAGATGIVRAQFGSHPYASPGYYREDREHIAEYLRAATAWLKTGDRGEIDGYIAKYIRGAPSHADYLGLTGFKRLLELHEY